MPSPKTQFALPAASLAAALLLAACGGGGPSGVTGGGGSSSGSGEFPVLAGTFVKHGVSLSGSDPIFGAVNSKSNGFFADFGASKAIYSFDPSSESGSVDGFFAAYAAVGSNLGSGLTLQQGAISGTVTQSNSVVTANTKFANTASGFSDTVTISLDNPQTKPVAFSTSAGTYTASYSGGTAISSTGFSNDTAATYSLTLNTDGSFTLSTSACTNSIPGTATLDGTYNVYTLSAQVQTSSNCANNVAVTLEGLAVYLPAGASSPLDGSTLTAPMLVVEMDDMFSHPDSPNVALTILATRTASP